MKNFIGRDGFVWWIGSVEDTNDPLTLGRCRVRIFGYHGDAVDIPTENLPFAVSIHPINTPNLYGTPRIGDLIFGFFLDSTEAQEPAMLGYFPGIPKDGPRNFQSVTQKESVLLDINGAKIEIDKEGNVTVAASNTLTFKDATNTLTLQQIKTGLDLGLVLPVSSIP